jgi:hypothetical protein
MIKLNLTYRSLYRPSKEKFRTAINAYKKNKAPGPDEFRAECLQAMDDLTVNYIIKLYGASIALG